MWCLVDGHSVSVKTSKGVVEGYTLNDVSVFEGIPYAKPPLGDLRFQVRIMYFISDKGTKLT